MVGNIDRETDRDWLLKVPLVLWCGCRMSCVVVCWLDVAAERTETVNVVTKFKIKKYNLQ